MRIKTSDKIITSDNIEIDGFSRIREVACEIRNTKVMQGVAREEGNNLVRYNDHSIRADAYDDLKKQIPNLLRDMKQCSIRGKVYSGSNTVFQEEFATFLNFLFAWLGCMGSRAGVNGLVIKDALGWLALVMTHMRYQSDDVNCVKDVVNQL
jgi:hypothetical protein